MQKDDAAGSSKFVSLSSSSATKFGGASSSSARKVIPRRLEEELSSLPRYKAKGPLSAPATSLADIMDDSVERAMYDQILGPLINRRPTSASMLSRSRPSSSNSTASSAVPSGLFDPLPLASGSGADTSSSSSFNASVLTRLAAVESENKSLRRQLAEKVLRVDTLERENRQMTRQLDLSSSHSSAKSRELVLELEESRQREADLEAQIDDMERFLSDYGLVWVGTQEQQQLKESAAAAGATTLGSPSPASSSSAAPPGVSFHQFSLKVQELNNLIASEPTQIKVEDRRARLLHATDAVEHIPLTFYRNGLLIRRGPFRANGSPSYTTFVQDILDGFFPSEFRSDYPDGVILELRDRHIDDYSANKEQKMSAAQFVRRMPKNVIRNGLVVEIRDEVDKLLHDKAPEAAAATSAASRRVGGGKGGVVVLTTPAASASPSLIAFVTVQVRWIDGSILQAKMFQGDVIGDVREHIRRHLSTLTLDRAGQCAGGLDEEVVFELRAAYPPRLLEDHMTLEEAGLVPTGVVHARRI